MTFATLAQVSTLQATLGSVAEQVGDAAAAASVAAENSSSDV